MFDKEYHFFLHSILQNWLYNNVYNFFNITPYFQKKKELEMYRSRFSFLCSREHVSKIITRDRHVTDTIQENHVLILLILDVSDKIVDGVFSLVL